MSGTDAGTYVSDFTGRPDTITATDGTVYDVTYVTGTLTISKASVVVNVIGDNATDEYDGTSHEVSGFVTDAPDGVSVSMLDGAVAKASRTDVGTTEMGLSSDKFSVDGGNNYDVTIGTVTDGYQTVTPISTRRITITAGSGSKTYDGTPMSSNGFTYTQGVLKDGDRLVITTDGSITDAGTTGNHVVSYKVMRGDVDVTDGYSFATPVDGTLSVTPAKLVIVASDASKLQGQQDPSLTYSTHGLVNDETPLFSGNVTRAKGEDAGQYGISQGDLVAGDNGSFKASNYDITFVPATFTIVDGNGSVTIVKSLSNHGSGANGAFAAGETAEFDIVVTNKSDYAVSGMSVTDDLTGASIASGDGYDVVSGTAKLDTIEPGRSVTVHAEYVVTDDDVDNGGTKNVATLDQPGVPPTKSNTVDVPTVPVPVIPSDPTVPSQPSDPTTPDGTVPSTTPTERTPIDDVVYPVAQAMQDAYQTVVSPMAAPDGEPIDDDESPLANNDVDCWVHWYIFLGMLVTIIYGACVLVRRRRFTDELDDRMKNVLNGNDDDDDVTVIDCSDIIILYF